MVLATQSKEQKIKTKTSSLKAAPQSQNQIYDTATKHPGTQDLSCLMIFATQSKEQNQNKQLESRVPKSKSKATPTTPQPSTQGRRIYPAQWYSRHKAKSKRSKPKQAA